jgi:hypothetical protein
MDKPTAISHRRIEEVYKDAPHLDGFPAERRPKAEARKPAAKDKTHLWDSAFQADRGCLGCGLGPRHPGPHLQH